MSIRLFKFDDGILEKILKIMQTVEIITLSFCSKACKRLAKVNLRPCSFLHIDQIRRGDCLRVNVIIRGEDLSMELGNDYGRPREARDLVLTISRLSIFVDPMVTIRMPRYKRSSAWIAHLMDITGLKAVQYLTISNNKLTMQSIYDCVSNYRISTLVLRNTVTAQTLSKIGLFTNASGISLGNATPLTVKRTEKILARNFESVNFVQDLKIDNILASSTRRLHINLYRQESRMSEKDLNRFVKHWQRGACPYLTHLEISFSPTIMIDGHIFLRRVEIGAILRGVNYRMETRMEREEAVDNYFIRNKEHFEARVFLGEGRRAEPKFELIIDRWR